MSYASIWIRFPASVGMMFAALHLKSRAFSMGSAFVAGRKPAARAECTLMYASNRVGRLRKFVGRLLPYRERSSVAPQHWPVRNGGRKSVMASSLTITRTRRIARHAPPIQCDRSQMLAFRLLFTGKKCPIAIRRTLPSSQFLSASRKSAIRMPRSMHPLARWKNCWN